LNLLLADPKGQIRLAVRDEPKRETPGIRAADLRDADDEAVEEPHALEGALAARRDFRDREQQPRDDASQTHHDEAPQRRAASIECLRS
jgi:hypothetical protein